MSSMRAALEVVGTRIARERRTRLARRLALRAWCRSGAWMLAVPFLTLLLVMGARFFGLAGRHPGLLLLLMMSFVPAALLALIAVVRLRLRPLDPREGLARLDRELRSEGRLQAAWEFSGTAQPTPFMEAAIADAQPVLARADAHRLIQEPRAPLPMRAWLSPLLAALLAVIATLLRADFESVSLPTEAHFTAADSALAERAARVADEPEQPAAPLVAPEAAASAPRVAGVAGEGAEQKPQANAPQDPKSSRGLTGEGAAATPAQASASSESQGFPSAKADSREAGDSGQSPTPKPRQPKPASQTEPPKKKATEESGSTAGKGIGHGSSRNPGSTDWESKDQTSTDEEDPLDDDGDVDDEDSESEARGGLQPSLRDRRPAVNRDLRIAFGNRPNPDANGRGAGGEQKKSRGVASLVLGVPIPDHVKGKPNPGRTKITQERVEPKAEDAPPADAVAHSPRSGSPGILSQFDLEPWMRALVRGYFDRGGSAAERQAP